MRSIYTTFATLIFVIAAVLFTTDAHQLANGSNVPMDYGLEAKTFSFSDIANEPSDGTPADQLFTVGMFQDSYGFQNLSLNQISEITGQSITDTSLSSFELIQNLSVSQLVSAIPELGQLSVSMSAPIQALAQKQGIDIAGGSALIKDIAPLIQGDIGQLGSDLGKYAIGQIPGLGEIALKQLPGWENAQIASIPGLSNLPLINPFSLKDYFVPFDIPFGMSPCKVSKECREFDIDNTASGNFDDLSIPCVGGPCSHIEVTRWGNDTSKIRWISKEQKVPGGNGFLCTEEPTGRFPFGKNPKVVIEKIDEESGEVEFALYFSVDGPFGLESAHCFGPFPMPFWSKRKEGQLILFGPDKPGEKTALSDLVESSKPQLPGNGETDTDPETPTPPQDCKGSASTFVRPTSGPITGEFGYSAWRRRNHDGMDIAPPYGTAIVAANCGVVSFNDWAGGYGNMIRIKHPGGGETLYAHRAEPTPFLSVGTQVKRGQQIGRVGSTGFSTGPHLHFEWHPNGWRNPVNPRRLGVF